jgi:hypothetical protein
MPSQCVPPQQVQLDQDAAVLLHLLSDTIRVWQLWAAWEPGSAWAGTGHLDRHENQKREITFYQSNIKHTMPLLGVSLAGSPQPWLALPCVYQQPNSQSGETFQARLVPTSNG